MFSKTSEINWLSAARFFLFGSRDVWFVVALPVFLTSRGWTHSEVGAFLAFWIIGYGIVQATAPILFRNRPADGVSANQAPQLQEMVRAGTLPPLDERGTKCAEGVQLARGRVLVAVDERAGVDLVGSHGEGDRIARPKSSGEPTAREEMGREVTVA